MNGDGTDWLFRTTPLRKSYRDDESIDQARNEGGSPALSTGHGVSFGEVLIPRGGIIALVGVSGTGKTTLFNLLAGLDGPDRSASGKAPRILLNPDGEPVDICAQPQGFPRERVGFIFQAGFLVRNATAGLNLSLPLAQRGIRADRADLANRLATLGIEDASELDRRAWQFSGGEAQRIAFVRSIAHDPELIFADEPTSNVDFENAVKIMGQLRDWVHDPAHPGRTLLWITHDLRLAAAITDAVLVLYRDDSSALSPLRLPGEPQGEAGRDHHREEVLERWTYSREALLADAPVQWRGTGSAPAQANPAADRAGRPSRTWVRFGAMAKLALSEVFGRQRAQQSAAVQQHVNPALSVAGGNRGSPLLGLVAWLRAFGHWNPVLTLVLILSLGGTGWAVLGPVDDYYRRAINDPRNCHVIIKEVRERTIDNVGYGDLDLLGKRPWAPAGTAGTTPAGRATEVEPRATCAAGAAAYGRRDARGWGIALAHDGQCPSTANTYVRLLTADDYEPIWTEVKLLAAPNVDETMSLAAFFDAKDVVENDVLYIADHLEQDLGAERLGELVGSQVCLFDPTWPRPVQLRIDGILDRLPSWERSRFSGYIPSYTYDAFRSQIANPSTLIEGFTHIALYFDSANLDALERYLKEQGYGFVQENLEKIRRLLGTATTFKTILLTFLGMVAVLLVLLTATSVGSYLATNAQSFALLRAFGMNWRFVAGVLLIEITVGWLVAMALLSVVIAAIGLYNSGHWWVFDHTVLTGAMVWSSFLQVSAVVLGLSVMVTLAMTGWWWHKNKYVAHVLKTG